MKRVIKYVLDTSDYGLKMELKNSNGDGIFDVLLYSDSD